ncbi:MAG TPA: glycosyl hydrolase, partial [Planctomycetota bacterium]|nr:glycosyl hydrolase [Planctomycetota bacterium]
MRTLAVVPLVFAALLPAQQDPPGPVAKVLLDTLAWRCIGPFRGGRVAAVTGVAGDRDTYYFGATGGGVWQTTDAGKNWKNVSDGAFGGSIGAVAVSDSTPDVVYVGGGEKTWRGNVSSGDGMWKSTDAGAHWEFIGLPDSRHIARIRIHPKNPDLVYAAVMGHVSGKSEERGVFRSKDGGRSWERILFANDLAGAVDLCFQPGAPDTLYASTWRAIRTPWSLESGGDGSALWKTTDGGDHWTELSKKPGMPAGTLGIICMSVSPAEPRRVYAMVEADDGGLFRSEDAGDQWSRVNSDRDLRQRAWYFSRCYADSKDADTVYVLNVGFHKSTDGGKKFQTIAVPHGDNHDLWIDPKDPLRLIEGNDGGATVSSDGGRTWSLQGNQPTAQFYRVTTDDHAPYRVYGAQQDNSTVRISSRGRSGAITAQDWESTAGGESGWLAPQPGRPEVVFGGSYGGLLQRLDHQSGISRNVAVWPDNPMGWGAGALKYRFQWSYPILFSRHDPDTLYAAANVLFKTRNDGQTWTPISPDLTHDDKQKQESSGGPITKDNTSVEYYCTIFTVAESALQQGVIWCGSDDGLVHVTRDAGRTWQNVTPPALPEGTQINCIDAHPFQAGGAYVAGTRYKLDDFHPYLFVTEDFGQSWREIDAGIEPKWFTRCIRADPVRAGLLFCGTERTVYLSFNDGRLWQKMPLNLPPVPVTDLCIKGDQLIAATQGRSFWMFDDLPHLRQLSPEMATAAVQLFAPTPYELGPTGFRRRSADDDDDDKEQPPPPLPPASGKNPPAAAEVRFLIGGDADAPITDEVVVEFSDRNGIVQKQLSSASKDDKDKLVPRRGMNVVHWDLQWPDAKQIKGMILWGGNLRGPRAAPGSYTVRLQVGKTELRQQLLVKKDPRSPATEAELQARFEFVLGCRDTLTRTHETILQIRALREQLDAVVGRADGDARQELEARAKSVKEALTRVEEALYQTKSKSAEDPLNFPIKLNNKLAGVMASVNGAE